MGGGDSAARGQVCCWAAGSPVRPGEEESRYKAHMVVPKTGSPELLLNRKTHFRESKRRAFHGPRAEKHQIILTHGGCSEEQI